MKQKKKRDKALDAPISVPVETIPEPSSRGRPPVDTVPVHLRVPRDLMALLAAESAHRTRGQGRTVTVQKVILDMLADRLLQDG